MGNAELSDVRNAKNADSAPQPIDDQSLERVAGGGTTYTVTFPGGCTHTINHPSNSISESDLFEIAASEHDALCT